MEYHVTIFDTDAEPLYTANVGSVKEAKEYLKSVAEDLGRTTSKNDIGFFEDEYEIVPIKERG